MIAAKLVRGLASALKFPSIMLVEAFGVDDTVSLEMTVTAFAVGLGPS